MNKVISFGSSKESALYFEEVLPDDIIHAALGKIPEYNHLADFVVPLLDSDICGDIIESLLPKTENAKKIVDQIVLISSVSVLVQLSRIDGFEKIASSNIIRNFEKELKINIREEDIDTGEIVSKMGSLKKKVFKAAGFLNAPSWVDNRDPWISGDITTIDDKFSLSLHNINLIDPSKLSWEEIIEFRKDKNSQAALVNLRLFFRENFLGKDVAYIQDKLLSLISEQENISKIWGFESAIQSLSVAFNNRSLIGMSAGALATTLAGAPLSIAAAGTIAVPIGSIALEFAKSCIENRKGMIKSPVLYLTKIKKLAKK